MLCRALLLPSFLCSVIVLLSCSSCCANSVALCRCLPAFLCGTDAIQIAALLAPPAVLVASAVLSLTTPAAGTAFIPPRSSTSVSRAIAGQFAAGQPTVWYAPELSCHSCCAECCMLQLLTFIFVWVSVSPWRPRTSVAGPLSPQLHQPSTRHGAA